jgi:SAM-dependent methyltransferase
MIRALARAGVSPLNRWRLSVIRSTCQMVFSATPAIRTCNICGFVGYFGPQGTPVRPEASCSRCHSLERHRTFKLWFDRNLQLFSKAAVLHFAPENAVAQFVKPASLKYVTADIEPGRADLSINIEAISMPDAQFDIILCSHVLEHVDDRKALKELYRILKPGGLALLMTPVIEGWDSSYEDPSKTTEAERWLYFGQNDHVRRNGADIRHRIREAGFALDEFTSVEPYVTQNGLIHGDKLFLARRTG